ncbi:hypothetical protein KA005_33945 [bacterium]|nr:hypothetical protein [bacterium]
MSILKVFNSQFNEFLTDILVVFPDDTNVKTAKFYVEKLMRVNPSLIIKAWHEYVTIPYFKEIEAGDFRFFLSKDYESDVGISESYDSENVLGAIQLIKTKAQLMSTENTAKIIKYLQNLTKLSTMYINKK